MEDILMRNMESIVAFCWSEAFWLVSSVVSQQRQHHSRPQEDIYWTDVAGGTTNDVPFHELMRMNWLEEVGNSHACLFAHLPHLWATLPSPVAKMSQTEWQRRADWAEARLAQMSAAKRQEVSRIGLDDLCRCLKRMRACLSLMREHVDTMRQRPESLQSIPNPFDAAINKRSWERQFATLRREWYFSRPHPAVTNEDLAARLLLQRQFLFGRSCPGEVRRTFHRLHQYYTAMNPLTQTLRSFPALFWTLPVPLDMQLPDHEFEARLASSRLFLECLHRGKLDKLERLLIAYYWPEISDNLQWLEVVAAPRTPNCSEARRAQDLADALCFLHLMSLPLPGAPSLSALHRQNLLQAELRASDAVGGSDDVRLRISENREKARCQKMSKLVCWRMGGMQIPHRMDGVDGLVPYNYEMFQPCQDLTTLAWLHPHSRDRDIRFQPEHHEYFIKGRKTNGSVTGLVHHFAHPFNADVVIDRMVGGRQWPRAGYLAPECSQDALDRVRQLDPEVAAAFLERPRNDPLICSRLQCWPHDFSAVLQDLVLSKRANHEHVGAQ